MKNHDSIIFKVFPLPALLLLPDAPHFTIVSVNTAYLNFTGRKEADLQGKYFPDAFSNFFGEETNADISVLQQSLITVISTAKPNTMAILKHHIPIGNTNKSEARYWNYEHIPVLDSKGKITFIIHAINDVTEKILLKEMREKAGEQAMMRSTAKNALLSNGHDAIITPIESNLEALINSTDDLIWSVSSDFKLITANNAFIRSLEAFAGVRLKPGEDMLIKDVFPESYLVFWDECYNKALSGKPFKKEIYTPPFNEAKELWSETLFSPIYEKDKIVAIACYSRNITERKFAEEENRFKAELLNTIGQAVIAADRNGIINFWNNAAEEIYGWTAEDAIGKNIAILNPGQQKTKQADAIMRQLSNGHSWSGEFLVQRKDGELFPAFVTDSPVFDQNHKMTGIIGVSSDITEKKNAEKKIIDSEQRYRALFKQNLAGFYQTTIEGVILNCNNAFAKMLKYGSSKELLNTNAAELYFSSAERDNFIGNAIKKKKIYSNEGVLKCKDGSALYFLESVSMRSDPVTGEGLCDGIIIDITKRKLAENNLIIASAELQDALNKQILLRKETDESEKRFRQIVETAQEGIWLIDENDSTTLVNKKMCEIIEYSFDELMGEKIYHFMDAESKKNSLLQIERRKLGMSEIHDAVFCTKSGKQVLVNVSTNPVLNELGEYKGALAMITDITERKQAEIAVKNAFEEKNTILESIGDAFFTADKNWIVTYWNNQAEKMLGKRKDEIVGLYLWDAFSESIGSEAYIQYHKALETNEVTWFENYYAPLARWYEISVYPSENGLSVYFKDVTDRKLAEIRLSELHEDLQKKAKELAISNGELEQFAYVASHDLQEPLRMVTGFLSQLEKKYMDIIDDKGKQYIAFAVDGAKRMRQIIQDLLEFSRVGKIEDKQEDVDVYELVKEIEILVQKQVEETKAIISMENLPVIHTYKAPLRQVFQNLISNALKYSNKDISPLIHINASKLKDQWQFSVTDNGIGISEDYFERIFIIFQRLHNKTDFPGTGLGLAITKKIIENLGGKIWVESKEGIGSTFYFTL